MHCCIFQECTKSLWWSNVVTHPPSWLGGSPFKRGQRCVPHVNSSPHFVRKCPSTHNNFSPYKRGLGKREAAWVYIEACAYPHGYTQLHRSLVSSELNNRQKRADIFHHNHWLPSEMTSEKWLQKISYWWGANTQIWVIAIRISTTQIWVVTHNVASMKFLQSFPNVSFRRNQWWRPQILAAFFRWPLRLLSQPKSWR